MEKLDNLSGQAAERKFEVLDLEEKEMEKILENLKAAEDRLEVFQPDTNTYAAKLGDMEYNSSRFDFDEEASVRYDVMVFRDNKDNSSTLISSSPPYSALAGAEHIYRYLRSLYEKRQNKP